MYLHTEQHAVFSNDMKVRLLTKKIVSPDLQEVKAAIVGENRKMKKIELKRIKISDQNMRDYLSIL